MAITPTPWHVVRSSSLHGRGVFAATDIPAGTRILNYAGRRLTPEQADERWPVDPNDPYHTFYFALSSGKVIDGGQRGNDARWINHSCSPNCEARENAAETRVAIYALVDIASGAELTYDYGLFTEERMTRTLKQHYRCLCGTPECRGTMLALKKPRPRKRPTTAG
ncbi:SET domain-containing protein-lysine N-methyltransferase [Alcaligenaceae bacterium CGII-47]|nr:SET domain-containing protein-lysine N-methyltransferase [Alcaligenaceae bacterium CGII-47]